VDDLDWSAKFQEFGDTVVDTKSWFEPWQKASVTALEKAADTAEKTGVSFEDLFKGMAGDVPAATKAIGDLNKRIADQQVVVDNLTEATGGYNTQQGQANTAARDALHELKGYRGELEEAIGTTSDAIKRNELFAKAMGMTVEAYQAQEDAAAKAKEEQDAYNEVLKGSADPVTNYADILATKTEEMKAAAQQHADDTKEATGEAADSWEDYATNVEVSAQELIDTWNRQAEQAKAFQANLAIIAAAGGQALADELRAKGPEVGAAVAEVIANADPAQRQALIEGYGKATGHVYGDGVVVGLDEKAAAVREAWQRLLAPLLGPQPTWRAPMLPSSGIPGFPSTSGAMAPAPAPAPGNVRVYIDGNALRATIRGDVSAAAGRAAMAGTGRGRP
jgi:hypothetical protein